MPRKRKRSISFKRVYKKRRTSSYKSKKRRRLKKLQRKMARRVNGPEIKRMDVYGDFVRQQRWGATQWWRAPLTFIMSQGVGVNQFIGKDVRVKSLKVNIRCKRNADQFYKTRTAQQAFLTVTTGNRPGTDTWALRTSQVGNDVDDVIFETPNSFIWRFVVVRFPEDDLDPANAIVDPNLIFQNGAAPGISCRPLYGDQRTIKFEIIKDFKVWKRNFHKSFKIKYPKKIDIGPTYSSNSKFVDFLYTFIDLPDTYEVANPNIVMDLHLKYYDN